MSDAVMLLGMMNIKLGRIREPGATEHARGSCLYVKIDSHHQKVHATVYARPRPVKQQFQCKPLLLRRLSLLLGHDNIPQRKPRDKVVLLDKPRIDNLPLRVGVIEADLRPRLAECSPREKRKGKRRHTSNRRNILGTNL